MLLFYRLVGIFFLRFHVVCEMFFMYTFSDTRSLRVNTSVAINSSDFGIAVLT